MCISHITQFREMKFPIEYDLPQTNAQQSACQSWMLIGCCCCGCRRACRMSARRRGSAASGWGWRAQLTAGRERWGSASGQCANKLKEKEKVWLWKCLLIWKYCEMKYWAHVWIMTTMMERYHKCKICWKEKQSSVKLLMNRGISELK